MSNYKKKQEAAERQAAWEMKEPGQAKRDQQIIGSLYAIMHEQKIPIDKNKMRWFHAGAVWADSNPSRLTKFKLLATGSAIGIVIGVLTGIFIMLLL